MGALLDFASAAGKALELVMDTGTPEKQQQRHLLLQRLQAEQREQLQSCSDVQQVLSVLGGPVGKAMSANSCEALLSSTAYQSEWLAKAVRLADAVMAVMADAGGAVLAAEQSLVRECKALLGTLEQLLAESRTVAAEAGAAAAPAAPPDAAPVQQQKKGSRRKGK